MFLQQSSCAKCGRRPDQWRGCGYGCCILRFEAGIRLRRDLPQRGASASLAASVPGDGVAAVAGGASLINGDALDGQHQQDMHGDA